MEDFETKRDELKAVLEEKGYNVETWEKKMYADAPPWICGCTVKMDNGYSADITIGGSTYGGPDGKYEGAVIKGDKLVYDTHVTDNVEGWLSLEEAVDFAEAVDAIGDPEAEKECDWYDEHDMCNTGTDKDNDDIDNEYDDFDSEGDDSVDKDDPVD